jgi:hypothetical protein
LKKKVHDLTTAQKIARVEKCKQQLLALHAKDEVILSDKKLFLYEGDPSCVPVSECVPDDG